MAGGIFCIENWTGDLRSPDSVLPLLNFVRESGAARVIHQRVSTPRELHHYIARFADIGTYRVGYLAMHGAKGGKLYVGRHEVTLESLGKWARLDEMAAAHEGLDDPEPPVDLSGKVIYLGSCATLNLSPARLEKFRKDTGAQAVCGFRKSVDWFESGALDVMLLSVLAQATDGDGSPANAIKKLRRTAADLLDHLGFVCHPDWQL